jgi:alkyl sulfatase BDS1-like metallo-beta-lactamase superfamily hydrolase
MRHRESSPRETANATLRVTRSLLVGILTKQVSFRELLTTEALEFEGSLIDMLALLALLDPPDTTFPIVTP